MMMGLRIAFCGKTPLKNLISYSYIVPVVKMNLEEMNMKTWMVSETKNNNVLYHLQLQL